MKLGISRNNQTVKRKKEERKVIDDAVAGGRSIVQETDRDADKGPAWEL